MSHPMSRPILIFIALFLVAIAPGCSESDHEEVQNLQPYDNPFGPDDHRWEPQPDRHKPSSLQFCKETGRLFVAQPGPVDDPGDTVAVVDIEERRVTDYIGVGKAPYALALHPDAPKLVVANRFSDHLSIIDVNDGSARDEPADFYVEDLLFDDDGDRLFAANRRDNSVSQFHVGVDGGELRLDPALLGGETEIPVGFNPFRLALSPDEQTLYAASAQGLAVTAVDISTDAEHRQPISSASPVEVDVDDELTPPDFAADADTDLVAGTERLWLGAPAFDLHVDDEHLFVATLSRSTHHPPGDGDDHTYSPPTDGSPNEGFRDLKNELAVIERGEYGKRHRYTSAFYCCPDVRDVPPDDPDRGDLVPDESLQIVEGALPTAVANADTAAGSHLLVAYGGSNELQRFDVDGADITAGPVVSVGFDPRDLVVDPSRNKAYVLARLSESVTVVDLDTFEAVDQIDLTADDTAEFPATDAELGELLFYSGAQLSIDGGQTCNHCHFDRGNIGKFFQMPWFDDPRAGRITRDTRGLYDTLPWYLEGFVDHPNPDIELSEMVYIDNFCCEDHPDPAGCAQDPPSECSQPPYSKRPPTRDDFLMETAEELVGRTHSFGQAVDTPLDFRGVSKLLGLYLIHRPGLLPNPNRADSDAAQRGRRLFESAETGCAVCHPAPTFGVSTDVNPFDTPLLFAPVVEPARDADDVNLNRLSTSFLNDYPQARQEDGDVYFTSPSLRGMWDRAGGFYHHGRTLTLIEALAPPGHPALDDNQEGYNVTDGVFDAHGATGHLTEDQLLDLVEFILTL